MAELTSRQLLRSTVAVGGRGGLERVLSGFFEGLRV